MVEDKTELIKKWYSARTIQILLIRQFKERESIFLSTNSRFVVRWLRLHNSTSFINAQKYFNFYKKRMNIYNSIGKYNKLPILTINWKIRKQQQAELNKKINENYEEMIKEIDFVMDFDSENIDDALIDVLNIKYDLDRFKVEYQTKLSGKKGFHIIIPYEIMPDLPDIEYYITFYKLICGKLLDKYKASTLDISIYDLKRIIKTAYSIDMRTNKVIMPLSDYELNHFVKEDYDISNIDYLLKMSYKKGLYFQNTDADLKVKKERFLYWINHINKVS